jgi:tetratricopeptide (TPR) repeat protein
MAIETLIEKQTHTKSSLTNKAMKSRIFDKVIFVSIWALFFGIPVFFLNSTFQGIIFEKQMYFYFWLLIGIIAWIIKGVTEGALPIRRTPFDVPILFLWAMTGIATIFSVDIWRSFLGFFGDPSQGFLASTSFVLAYFFILSNVDAQRLQKLLVAFLMSGVIVLLFFVMAVFGISLFPANVLGSYSTLGIFASFLLPLFITALCAFSNKESLWGKARLVFLVLGLFLTLVSMLALYDFVPWIGVLLGLGVYLLFVLSRVVNLDNRLAWIPMVVFAGVLSIIMMQNTRLFQLNLPIQVQPRSELSWEVTTGSLKENMFFGTGPATYEYAFSKYALTENFLQSNNSQVVFDQGFGLFYHTLTTGGVVVSFAMMLLIGVGFIVGIYFLVRKTDSKKLLSLGAFSSVFILFLSSFFVFIQGSLLLVGVLLGILVVGILTLESTSRDNFLRLSVQTSPRFALALSFVSLLLMTGVVFVFVFMGRAFVADVYAGRALQILTEDRTPAVEYLVRAGQLYPREGMYYLRLSREYLALANNLVVKAGESEEIELDRELLRNYLQSAFLFANEGIRLMPASLLAHQNQAIVLDSIALFDIEVVEAAKQAYENLLKIQPDRVETFLKLAQLDVAYAQSREEEGNRGEYYQSAKANVQRALDVWSEYPLGLYQLGLIEELSGNTDSAIVSIERAIEAGGGVRQNPQFTFTLAQFLQSRDGEGDLERSGDLLEALLSINDKDVNLLLNTAFLSERKGNNDEALASYQEILEILPEEATEARTQIQTLIQNVRDGSGNINVPVNPVEGSENIEESPLENPENIEVENIIEETVQEGGSDQEVPRENNAGEESPDEEASGGESVQ